jgi:DNA-binding Lrp family transcriptional regulator
MENNQNNCLIGKFDVDLRRKQIASMLAQSMSETEIAEKLGVGIATVSRDVKALREMSRQFVFDLAKSDLAYHYVKSIDVVEAVLKRAWDIHNSDNTKSVRDKLLALKIIVEANKSRYELFERGPSTMNLMAMGERLDKIENRQIDQGN